MRQTWINVSRHRWNVGGDLVTVRTPNDVLGMHMLMTGLIVLLLSFIGVPARRVIPGIGGGHVVVITLILSVVIQLMWIYSLTLDQHTP